MDVGSLQPVEIIAIYNKENYVWVETDTNDWGRGASLEEALADLRETAPAVIYLDTAEYLLVEQGQQQYIETIKSYLKGSVRVCYTQEDMDLKDAVSYLRAHGDFPSIRHWETGMKLPVLTSEKFFNKMENNA